MAEKKQGGSRTRYVPPSQAPIAVERANAAGTKPTRHATVARAGIVAGLALALAGCGPIPRDAAGTLDGVQASRSFRLGLVEGVHLDPREEALVREVANAVRARPVVARGALDPLLLRLEAGELDLVIGGRFAPGTGWKKQVWLGPALATEAAGEERAEARPAARNGENGWIVIVDREARALEPRP